MEITIYLSSKYSEIIMIMSEVTDINGMLELAENQGDDELELEMDFEEAAKFVRGLATKANKEDLLYFYARYKQANEGPCHVSKPSFYQLSEKAKWSAWSELGDMESQEAMREYIEKLTSIEPNWKKLEAKDPTSGWVSVSTHIREREEDGEEVWDHAKHGRADKLRDLLASLEEPLGDMRDESGMSLLHWAADRGHTSVAQTLLDLTGAESTLLNAQDSEGQTALHFAVACSHLDMVKLLLERGADPLIQDEDGFTACNSDSEQEIKNLFSNI